MTLQLCLKGADFRAFVFFFIVVLSWSILNMLAGSRELKIPPILNLSCPTSRTPLRSQADMDKLRLQELKNGRLAMLSVAACASEHWITGAVPFLTGQGY